jgi:hypothetical protein
VCALFTSSSFDGITVAGDQVEHVSPRDVCRLARFPERICGSDGRFHTTTSKVIQPVVEPQAPADGHTGVEHLLASWDAIKDLDPGLASDMQAMTAVCGGVAMAAVRDDWRARTARSRIAMTAVLDWFL